MINLLFNFDFSLLEDYTAALEKPWKMDLHILLYVLSVMYSGILHAALSAPAGGSPTASAVTQGRHARTKRCSCSTFLDKECVYFCHLDIIWVNTPERVVSYGLGNAPRAKRALTDSMVTSSGPRCKCLRDADSACSNFCQPGHAIRYEKSADTVIPPAYGDGCAETQCKHKLAVDTGRIKRMKDGNKKLELPQALRAVLRTRLLLEKWRAKTAPQGKRMGG
ncbi:endothelin-1 [Genypterus blacodes]|uniref:endothelin-1 n=1 Tax=Genypterus blacodes TaxID=154954 RepID=UPI003F767102